MTATPSQPPHESDAERLERILRTLVGQVLPPHEDMVWVRALARSAAQAQEQLREAHLTEARGLLREKAANERIGVLEAALKPFAASADRIGNPHCSDDLNWDIGSGILTGDVRRARAALSTPAEKD